MILIIANILSFIGNTLFTLSSLFKSKRNILLLQSANHILAVISEIMTAAYSGMVQEAVSLIRNIIFLFAKAKNKMVELIITLTGVVIAVTVGIIINVLLSGNVWYGYLPIGGTIVYSTFVILAFMLNVSELKGEALIKIGLALNSILWGTYGLFVELYPILIFNGITLILCILSLIRIKIIKNKINENSEE